MRRRGSAISGSLVLVAVLGAAGFCRGQGSGAAGESAEAQVEAAQDTSPSLDRGEEFAPVHDARHEMASAALRSPNPRLVEPDPLPTATRSGLLIGLYASQVALQILDAHSTLRAVGSGTAREANPVVGPLATHPAALVSFKLGLAAGTILGVDRLHKRHPVLAVLTLAAINGGYVYIVQRNYRSCPAR